MAESAPMTQYAGMKKKPAKKAAAPSPKVKKAAPKAKAKGPRS